MWWADTALPHPYTHTHSSPAQSLPPSPPPLPPSILCSSPLPQASAQLASDLRARVVALEAAVTVNGPKEAGMVSGKVSDKSTVSGKVSNAGRGGLAVEVGDADGDAAEALTSRVSEGGGVGCGGSMGRAWM